MDEPWVKTKLLIIGKTYPNHSVKYRETACTGAMLYETHEMIRIYPIPYRYLEGSEALKPYQIIEADLQRDTSDPRPESYKIKFSSIRYVERVKTQEQRREYLERSPHLFGSIEEMRSTAASSGMSLGIVKPREIVSVRLEPKSEEERDAWLQKEKEVTAQLLLFGEQSKPLDFPEAKFFVKWLCDDSKCSKPHEMSLHQWGIHELYRKYKDRADGGEKVIAEMHRQLDLSKQDVYFFLGSFRTILNNFGLMDSHSFRRQPQLSLLGGIDTDAPEKDDWWAE